MSSSTKKTAGRSVATVATQIMIVLMTAALLAGCGKKGNPTPPAGEPTTYPQSYPRS
ncbi:MAG TPA: hypothetical protein VM782_04125 [Stellaceae bacterium]|nr:hypothetical protein [Stellaceae bacterium]